MTGIPAQSLLTEQGSVGRWVLDSQATTVRLSHKTMWGLSTVRGEFTQVSGEGSISAGGAVSGTLRVAAASIDTGNAKRDTHLRSADFFDVELYPDITVGVSSATVAAEGVELRAELTVKGMHEPLDLEARIVESAPDTVTVAVDKQFDRERFGMSWNQLGMVRGPASISVSATFHRERS